MGAVREAMIVAGGQGTRLRPLTWTTPKPLLPFCGRPFLAGVIRHLAAVGVQRVLLVVGADTVPFLALAEDAGRVGITVDTVPEPRPLDTAGGVQAALDRVSDTFLVLNGDILTGLDLGHLIEEHHRAGAVATLALTRVQDTSAYGVCVRKGKRIVDFVEKPAPGSLPGQDAVNAGTYVLEPTALDGFPVGPLSFERQVFPELVSRGEHVHGVVSDAVWADLGTPERFLEGQRLVLDGAVAWPLPYAILGDAADASDRQDIEVATSVVIRGPVLLGSGTVVGRDATIGPYVVAGANVRIGQGSQLRDSAVFDEAILGADTSVAGALLGYGAVVGQQAQVGERTVIGDDQRVRGGARVAPNSRLPARR